MGKWLLNSKENTSATLEFLNFFLAIYLRGNSQASLISTLLGVKIHEIKDSKPVTQIR
jgi:hypothetical protein